MAYNSKNFLKRVLNIQEIALHYSKKGLFFKEIYHLHIQNQYNICKRTFDTYLGINARKELRELQEQPQPNAPQRGVSKEDKPNSNQLNLF
jgi:hypothetical protein